MNENSKIYDVIIVGAGPAGSSVAVFLGRQGISSLILDREEFPRDKVCGDGLTPQAIYWIDRLGCIDEVLKNTRSCIRESDLYIEGEHILTGKFPDNTKYPDFSVLLDRKRLDNILLQNAVNSGAVFKPRCKVTGINIQNETAEAEVCENNTVRKTYKAKVIVGADGVSSIVSRSLGNDIKTGITAISLRAYFKNVEISGAQIKIYFGEEYFPGYGWLFADDDGFANIGLGYARDTNFNTTIPLRETFIKFIQTDLKPYLSNAVQFGKTSGGSLAFQKLNSIVGSRVLLVGDSANQADPFSGGGIHKAIESAFKASEAIVYAFNTGDFSKKTLMRYQYSWEKDFELDRKTGELFLTAAKNPALKNFYIFLLKNIGRLAVKDEKFMNFCSGIFSGAMAQNDAFSPLKILEALPRDINSWLYLVEKYRQEFTLFPGDLITKTIGGTISTANEIISRPIENIEWGMDVLGKAINLIDDKVNAYYK